LMTSIWSPFLLLAGNLLCKRRILILIPWFIISLKNSYHKIGLFPWPSFH
jgi:hypothetical protein